MTESLAKRRQTTADASPASTGGYDEPQDAGCAPLGTEVVLHRRNCDGCFVPCPFRTPLIRAIQAYPKRALRELVDWTKHEKSERRAQPKGGHDNPQSQR